MEASAARRSDGLGAIGGSDASPTSTQVVLAGLQDVGIRRVRAAAIESVGQWGETSRGGHKQHIASTAR